MSSSILQRDLISPISVLFCNSRLQSMIKKLFKIPVLYFKCAKFSDYWAIDVHAVIKKTSTQEQVIFLPPPPSPSYQVLFEMELFNSVDLAPFSFLISEGDHILTWYFNWYNYDMDACMYKKHRYVHTWLQGHGAVLDLKAGAQV